MSGQCFIMNANRMINQNTNELKSMPEEKVMSYEEKSVGSTPFYKCEACPYMALAEDDIKFHLFTVHPHLARSNGLADNIQILCPGCTSVFDAEETLRTHLRNHHKMGIKDVKKMIKSLVQIALKNAKLKKDNTKKEPPVATQMQDVPDVRIPQVIEIIPDVVNANSDLPKGVAFISVDELHKMSTPNFEKVDPKEIIQEASINIVYTNNINSTQYVCSVSEPSTTKPPCNVIQVSSVQPDLISSIQPRIASTETKLSSSQIRDKEPLHIPYKCKSEQLKEEVEVKKPGERKPGKMGTMCLVDNCRICLKEEKNLAYHRKCHQNGKLTCPECSEVFPTVESLHMHLWKIHMVDVELPTCNICGFKTYNNYRLRNCHMKCHKKTKAHICPICSKAFKTPNQLSKHKQIHKGGNIPVQCPKCLRELRNEERLKIHIAEVHDKAKKFKCSHCEYTSTRKEQLKMHMRSHTGDKPYACDTCNYRSSDHNALRRHKKQHSKEHVYKCKHCPYTAIQSTVFTSHMISKHPDVENGIHQCNYCPFKTVNKDKYVLHLSTHSNKDGIQLLMEMTKNKSSKPSWTIPSEAEKSNENVIVNNKQNNETAPKTVNEIPIEVYDCDSLSEGMPQNYSKNYCTTPRSDNTQSEFNNLLMVTDLSKDDNNSDGLISESSNDTMMERHQYQPQHPLLNYDANQSTLHEFLHTPTSMEQSILQNNNVNALTSNHCTSSISNNIMNNFPIRLPSVPQISLRNNITLKPVDKISVGPTKVTGPIITPTQILPVPLSNSPVHISVEPEGAPRKKPKISVKSNLILKGPDQVNMFHSQQKMAFRRLENNERYGLASPVTFNNLITTQFMQLQTEPALSESPNNIMEYPQEPMLADTATTPVDSELNDNPQIFSFNQQMNVTPLTMLPPQQKISSNDPSYIKLEATIKQNTQSPSLERMCNANLLNNSAISREYKASPPLEDIHKNMNEIKNEVKSDQFYNIPMNTSSSNQPIIDQYLLDNIMGEKYSGLMDLSGVVLQEISEQQNDVIEIDDNSDDNKLLPRLDMFFPLESLYTMHNDFHFLDNDIQANNMSNENEVVNRMVEVPIMNQKDIMQPSSEGSSNELPMSIQGLMDPVMNVTVRPTTKINVKNIELMKN